MGVSRAKEFAKRPTNSCRGKRQWIFETELKIEEFFWVERRGDTVVRTADNESVTKRIPVPLGEGDSIKCSVKLEECGWKLGERGYSLNVFTKNAAPFFSKHPCRYNGD